MANLNQFLSDLHNAASIIDDRLYFVCSKDGHNLENIHAFTIDHALRYEPFFIDFGPLNLGCLYKFCKLLDHKLKDERYKNSKIYYYCDKTPQRIANASYLIGAYQIISLNRHPIDAYQRIKHIAGKSVPFRDASMGLCTYRCSVEHCLRAIYNATKFNFLNFNNNSFNVDEYEHYERVECGDLNVIIPNKFIAFAGPYFKEFDEEGYPALTPEFYIPIWKKFGVSTIIRLNKKCYDKKIFTRAGLEHFDLYFVDGTTPNDKIIKKFLDICENSKGVLAVHCKAGLGRTGSCIGCYIMKHYGWSASDTIAWLRICRPGSVIGPQQHFLEEQQPKMWKAGDEYRKKHNISLNYDPRKDIQKQFVQRFKNSHFNHSIQEQTKQQQQQQQYAYNQNNNNNDNNNDNDDDNDDDNNNNNNNDNNLNKDDNKLNIYDEDDNFPHNPSHKHNNHNHNHNQNNNNNHQQHNNNNNNNNDNINSYNHVHNNNSNKHVQHHNNHNHNHNHNHNNNNGNHSKHIQHNIMESEVLATDPGQNQGKALKDAKRKNNIVHNNNNNNNNNNVNHKISMDGYGDHHHHRLNNNNNNNNNINDNNNFDIDSKQNLLSKFWKTSLNTK